MRKLEGARDCYIEKGSLMLSAALSFDHISRFWSKRPPPRDAVIVVAAENKLPPFAPIPARKLESRSSYSTGGSYRLGWRNVDDRHGNTTTEPVRLLSARFERETPTEGAHLFSS